MPPSVCRFLETRSILGQATVSSLYPIRKYYALNGYFVSRFNSL